MFRQPTKDDAERALLHLVHEAGQCLTARRKEIMDEARKAGALQSTRLIIAVAEAADRTHVDGMQQAASVLRDFVQRMNIPSSQIVEWARPRLESLSSMLLGAVPPCGFPA